jgi:hypothetical protein
MSRCSTKIMSQQFLPLFIYLVLSIPTRSFSQERNESVGNEHDDHLEFSHPLVTESISPDTKYRFTFFGTKTQTHNFLQTYNVELEYSPAPAFSIHLDVPYMVLKPAIGQPVSHFDDVELSFKFANFAFAENNILVGYGLSVGFPTGNQEIEMGNDHIWYVNPFFNGGVKLKRWEWTAFITFGLPANQHDDEFVPNYLETRFTTLYNINRRFQALLEAGNEKPITWAGRKENNYDITEGIKFCPDPEKPWILALGAREPLFRNDELKFQIIFSVFYHMKD